MPYRTLSLKPKLDILNVWITYLSCIFCTLPLLTFWTTPQCCSRILSLFLCRMRIQLPSKNSMLLLIPLFCPLNHTLFPPKTTSLLHGRTLGFPLSTLQVLSGIRDHWVGRWEKFPRFPCKMNEQLLWKFTVLRCPTLAFWYIFLKAVRQLWRKILPRQ